MEWICVAQNDTPDNNYSQYFCDSVLLFQWKRAKYFSPCKDEIYITLSPSSCRLPHAVSSVAITTVVHTNHCEWNTFKCDIINIVWIRRSLCKIQSTLANFYPTALLLALFILVFFSLHTFIKATNTFIELDVHTCIPEHWHSFTVN